MVFLSSRSNVTHIVKCVEEEGYSSLVSEIFGGQLHSELRHRARINKYDEVLYKRCYCCFAMLCILLLKYISLLFFFFLYLYESTVYRVTMNHLLLVLMHAPPV